MVKGMFSSRIFFVAYLVATVLIFSELVTRVYFAFEIGPRVLLYGTDWYRNTAPDSQEKRWQETLNDEKFRQENSQHLASEARPDSVERHTNKLRGYSKFFPNESKSTRDVETGERISTTINSHGFRGDEFELAKRPDVVRILTLGSSSTFGYYDRDDETYPHYLQKLLNERCPGSRRFEVINFGIPHSTSDQIAALFLAEGLALQPDVITFYEGRNDSVGTRAYVESASKIRSVLVHRSILVAYIDQVLVGERLSVDAPSENFDSDARRRSAFFLGNLDRINAAARSQGVLVIVANQQATASAPYPRPAVERLRMKGVTYQVETQEIKSRIDADAPVNAFEVALLTHQRLMQDLEKWAKLNDVPFVDLISALDQDRQHLLSWVHLTREANQIIANELFGAISSRFCSADSAGAAKSVAR